MTTAVEDFEEVAMSFLRLAWLREGLGFEKGAICDRRSMSAGTVSGRCHGGSRWEPSLRGQL